MIELTEMQRQEFMATDVEFKDVRSIRLLNSEAAA